MSNSGPLEKIWHFGRTEHSYTHLHLLDPRAPLGLPGLRVPPQTQRAPSATQESACPPPFPSTRPPPFCLVIPAGEYMEVNSRLSNTS
jgi:hypothetical protein